MSRLNITASTSALWSKMGTRATLGIALNEIAKTRDDFLILSADTSTSAGLERFRKNHSDKYIECGIGEQNMVGVASGLSLEGWKVIATTFSPFITLRCLEQLKVCVAYNYSSPKFVGLASGVVLGDLGFTHCSIEDVAAVRTIPNIWIFTPADSAQLVKALPFLLNFDKPVYIRLTGGANSIPIYLEDFDFSLENPHVLERGEDFVLAGCGTGVAIALEVRKILLSNGYNVGVINCHTIQPNNNIWVKKYLAPYKKIFSVEEHSIQGGLGTVILEALNAIDSEKKVVKFGLNNCYNKAGSYAFVKKKNGFTPEQIAENVLKELGR